MTILWLLLPVALLFFGFVVWGLIWTIRSNQYEDLEGPAYRVLMDDNDPRIPRRGEVAGHSTDDGDGGVETSSQSADHAADTANNTGES